MNQLRLVSVMAASILIAGAASANLLANPDFAAWTDAGHPTGWTVEDTIVTKTRVERESATVLSGPYSARLTRLVSGTGSNYGLKQYVPVAAGRVHSVSAWCFDDNVDASAGISVTWCRADSSSLGTSGTAYCDSSIHTWQRVVRTDTAPDSVVYAKVLLRVYGWTGNQPDGFVFFDDVAFDTGYGAVDEGRLRPALPVTRFELRPNPARGSAAVAFSMDRPGSVDLALHDPAGRRLVRLFSGRLGAGRHRFTVDGRDARGAILPAGACFLVLDRDGRRSSCKLLLQP